MGYSAVYTLGDSLVDSGNVLKVSRDVDRIPFFDAPDGAPLPEMGYFEGRFSNGYNFADLITNKLVGAPAKPVYPFGFEDPFLGISFSGSDPTGNNLNFAYGGAQIIAGSVPDLDDQTDAYKDAVDNHASPTALHLVTMGGNDVRELVPADGAVASAAAAQTALSKAAQELYDEMRELIAIGARHFVITGVPDVGVIPHYNGLADEAARRAAATQYSTMLDAMIQARVAQLQANFPAVQVRYVSLAEVTAAVVTSLAQIYDSSLLLPLNQSKILFFDQVHPTGQGHAMAAAAILERMNGAPAGETIALAAPDLSQSAGIGLAGEVDRITLSLAANTAYRFELLGISSGSGTLADPALRLLGPGGALVAADDDGGLGLDASLSFTTGAAGDHVLELRAVGTLTGSYRLQASGDTPGDDLYLVSNASALILERPGEGHDTVLASVSYRLASGVSVEALATSDAAGTAALGLTGNALAQSLTGNAGANSLDGGGGGDVMAGLGGDDAYYVRDAGDRVIEAAGGGSDRIYAAVSLTLEPGSHVELVTPVDFGSTEALNFTGNALSQAIFGNAAANRLDGGGGGDTLVGLGGDDLYVIRHAGDRAVEYAGGGNDRVFAAISFALEAGSQIEILTTDDNLGGAAIDLTGNALNQYLYGNAGANRLDGQGGADVLIGFGGADLFAFTTGLGSGNVDRILDLQPGVDKVALDDAIFAGLGLGALPASAFVTGSAAQDADDRILYDPATGTLSFDADGSGAGVAVPFATLSTGLVLAAGDIVVI